MVIKKEAKFEQVVEKRQPGGHAYLGSEILKHYQDLVYHLETKANWLIGICSVVIVMVVTRYDQIGKSYMGSIGEMIIVIGCLIALFNLMFVLVPKILPGRKYTKALNEVNLFEYKNILRNFDRKEFAQYLGDSRIDHEEVNRLYTHAIYQLVSFRLPAYSRRLSIGGWTLIVSLLLGTLFIGLGLIV